MLQDITIGQYYPTNSIIHKLDPRVKLLFTFVFMVSLFITDSFASYIFIIAVLMGVISITKIPFIYIFEYKKDLPSIGTKGLKSRYHPNSL